MKKISLLLLLVVLNGTLCASQSDIVAQLAQRKTAMDALPKSCHCTGSITTRQLTMGGEIYVANACSEKMTINGNITIEKSNATKEAKVSGSLKATNVTFGDTIFGGSFASFVQSTVQSVRSTYHTNKADKEVTAIIELIDTTVNGDITFEGAPGVVIIHGNTAIHGNVHNGSIEQWFN